MNDESNAIRHEPRFSVRKLDATVVTVAVRNCDGDSAPNKLNGVAADVSETGLRLALDGTLPKGAEVSIHFRIPEIEIDLMFEGVVRWVQPKDRKSWWVGCSLDEPISRDSLAAMATNAIMDRRQDDRLPASCRAQAKWELTSDIVNVNVTDYSLGGCAFRTDHPIEPASDRVMLLFDSEDGAEARLPVRVIWSRGGTSFGCAFLSNHGYLLIRQFVESESQALTRARKQALKSGRRGLSETRWRWIAVTATVLLALQTLDVFRERDSYGKRFQHGLQTVLQSIMSRNSEDASDAETVSVSDAEPATSPDI